MSTEEKTLVENLTKVVGLLPESERKFLSGYAEGVIAARLTAQLGAEREVR